MNSENNAVPFDQTEEQVALRDFLVVGENKRIMRSLTNKLQRGLITLWFCPNCDTHVGVAAEEPPQCVFCPTCRKVPMNPTPIGPLLKGDITKRPIAELAERKRMPVAEQPALADEAQDVAERRTS